MRLRTLRRTGARSYRKEAEVARTLREAEEKARMEAEEAERLAAEEAEMAAAMGGEVTEEVPSDDNNEDLPASFA